MTCPECAVLSARVVSLEAERDAHREDYFTVREQFVTSCQQRNEAREQYDGMRLNWHETTAELSDARARVVSLEQALRDIRDLPLTRLNPSQLGPRTLATPISEARAIALAAVGEGTSPPADLHEHRAELRDLDNTIRESDLSERSSEALVRMRAWYERRIMELEPGPHKPEGWPDACGQCGADWTHLGHDIAEGFCCNACGASDSDETNPRAGEGTSPQEETRDA